MGAAAGEGGSQVTADITPEGRIRAVCTGDEDAAFLRKLLPARRQRDGAWLLPLTAAMTALLQAHGAALSPQLARYAQGCERVQRYVEAVKLAGPGEPLKPPPLRAPYTLYQHQCKAYSIALALPCCALLMDMGTGKSICTVMVAGRRYLDGKIRRLLIVAPTSVCAVWPAEFARFGDFPAQVRLLLGTRAQRVRALQALTAPTAGDALQVAVINYEAVWRVTDAAGKRDYLQEYRPDMIVLDESQRIKNPQAKQSRALHRLGDGARYRMILTGTPIQKNTLDLWSQYRFLDPTVFPCSFYAFQQRYAVLGGYNGKQYLCPRNLPELTRRTHALAYRVRKEDCLDLPEKIFEDRPVLLDGRTHKLYQQLARDAIAELESCEITANHVLTRMLRLQQVTGGFLRDDAGALHQVHTAKLDALCDIAAALCLDEGKKLVVFARFLAELDAIQGRLEAMLGAAGLTPVRIDGSVASRDRGGLVEAFQTEEDCRVFLGEIDACAEGLTLTAASTAVYYSVNWNYAKYDQSLSRIHRIGQQGACTYIHLIAPHTIDERIMDALHRKEDLARSVVDCWRELLMPDKEGGAK